MKVATTLFALFFSSVLFAEWYASYPTNENLKAVWFVNDSTGWICGTNGVVLQTTDSGSSWIYRSIPDSVTVYDIRFFNETSGVACCANGKIFKTNDSGQNWTDTNPGGGYALSGIDFYGESRGIAVGGPVFGAAKILNSTDGGENWSAMNVSLPQFLDVEVLSQTDILISSATGEIIKSTNGGADWEEVHDNSTGSVLDFYFVNNSLGFAAGALGNLLKTTNGGTSWEEITMSGFPQHISARALHFFSESSGIAVCDEGYIFTTSNGGSDWTEVASPATQDLNDIFFVSETQGYIVGAGGMLLSTVEPTGVDQEPIPETFTLYQNYPNPFNPITTIAFSLPKPEHVRLTICDLTGRIVAILCNENLSAGFHTILWDAKSYSSGIYFYRLWTGKNVAIKRMVYLK